MKSTRRLDDIDSIYDQQSFGKASLRHKLQMKFEHEPINEKKKKKENRTL